MCFHHLEKTFLRLHVILMKKTYCPKNALFLMMNVLRYSYLSMALKTNALLMTNAKVLQSYSPLFGLVEYALTS